jgi:hypothetical protein
VITTPVSDISMAINAVVLLACVVSFGWRGYRRGVLRTLQRLISILSGYVACYFFAGALAQFLKTAFALNIFLSYIISAALLLCGVAFITHLLLSRLSVRVEDEAAESGDEQNTDEEQEIDKPAYPAGMIVGIVLGCVMGLLTVWLAGITIDAVALHTEGPGGLVYRTTDPVRKMAGNMVGGAVGYVVEQKTGHESLVPDLTAHLIADPVAMSQQIAEVSKSDEMKQFFSDPAIQLLMQENKIDELQRNEKFQTLINLPQTKIFLDVLSTSANKNDVLTQETRAAHLLTDLYRKARRIQTDSRFVALVDKPEFQRLLQNPSPAELMTNPLLKELAEIAFSNPPATASVHNDTLIREGVEQSFQTVEKPQWAPVDATPVADDAAVIYRWTDAQGQKHFSQTRPEGDYPLEIIKSQ